VVNVSPSTGSGGGYYNILNPFGNNVFSWIKLSPVTRTMTAPMGNNGPQAIGPEDRANSDFALTSAKATVAVVPEPTTLAGLGLISGLLMASRRRKASPVS
jgi:PEP-CTERM motif